MKIARCIPFALSKDEPTEMFVSFYAEGIRYDYQVKFDVNHILREELNYYPKGSKALFYERNYKGENLQADIKFGVSLRVLQKNQDSIRENTLNNHSVLSVCLKNTFKEDIEPLAKLHSYLMTHYHHVDGDAESKGTVEILKSAYEDGKKHKFIRILDTLYDLISGNHIYYLDELGEDLHYDLLFYYLNIFLFNSDQSQLLITSQETTLLSQDMINENRGAVWFVEKNKDTAASEYSRGDSYGLHKNLSLYNSYRIGRLGAKPELGSIFVDLEG